MHIHVILIRLSFVYLALASHALAQSSVQQGEIAMEQDTKMSDSYETQQHNAITFLKLIQASATAGGTTTIPMPTDSVLSYLNAAYLYCSITQGTCPEFLDAVLEADLINGRNAGVSAGCPIMTSFWKLYIKTDMEQRHSHYVKTGYLGVTDDFKKRTRPAYIKCKETVVQILTSPDRTSRYAVNSPSTASVAKAVRIAEELKSKVANLFVSLGAR